MSYLYIARFISTYKARQLCPPSMIGAHPELYIVFSSSVFKRGLVDFFKSFFCHYLQNRVSMYKNDSSKSIVDRI